jgi:hypothetical protein
VDQFAGRNIDQRWVWVDLSACSIVSTKGLRAQPLALSHELAPRILTSIPHDDGHYLLRVRALNGPADPDLCCNLFESTPYIYHGICDY